MRSLAEHKLTELEFCALDLETTGTNPLFHRIVEIGIIRFTLAEELGRYEMLVNPGMEIPAAVEAIHGIGDDMVKSQPVIGALLDEISRFIGDSLLVIHNPDFDLSFLAEAYKGNSRHVPEMRALDTVRLARHAYPDMPNHKLDTLCGYLNIPLSHHRALSDARGAMQVFREVAGNLDPGSTWRLSDILKFHGELARPRSLKRKKISMHYKNNIVMGRRVRIRYCDSQGAVTEREILPREYIRYGNNSYLLAYCYLRNSDRFFRTAGILSIV